MSKAGMCTINPANRTEVGDRRRAARDEWNLNELSIRQIFKEHDVDNSNMLEADEFRKLLQEFNGGKHVDDKEYDWMMSICDKDMDKMISEKELQYAMMSWHGYTHLKTELAQLFEKYDEDQSDDLDVSELQNLLTELNDGINVPEHQAEEVLQVADALRDGKIGRYELLGAVGTWYVAVGREPTPEMHVAIQSLTKQTKINRLRMFLLLVAGAIEIYFGYHFKTVECGYDLARLMLINGFVHVATLLVSIPLNLLGQKRSFSKTALVILMGCFMFASVVLELTGILMVIAVKGDCDRDLWQFCWYLFVLPVIVTACIIVCLGCYVCAALSASRGHEESLQAMFGSRLSERAPLMGMS